METEKETRSPADFRRRTFAFALRIARLVEALPENGVCRTFGNQLLRSGTSIGANSQAAKRARSRAEFIAKVDIVKEEADETLYWLELFSNTVATIKTARTQKRATA